MKLRVLYFRYFIYITAYTFVWRFTIYLLYVLTITVTSKTCPNIHGWQPTSQYIQSTKSATINSSNAVIRYKTNTQRDCFSTIRPTPKNCLPDFLFPIIYVHVTIRRRISPSKKSANYFIRARLTFLFFFPPLSSNFMLRLISSILFSFSICRVSNVDYSLWTSISIIHEGFPWHETRLFSHFQGELDGEQLSIWLHKLNFAIKCAADGYTGSYMCIFGCGWIRD